MNQADSNPNANLSPWWVPVDLEVGQCWRYRIGPLTLYLQRGEGTWLLGSEHAPDELDSGVSSEPLTHWPDAINFTRYVFNKAPDSFRLMPKLLDRPIVVHTSQPVKIPPEESVTFYISSPVSVNVELQNPQRALEEVPTLRLSDTWFGPSTQVGELCYAARTHARNSRSDLPLRPHRAVTPVMINNRSETLLTIEKLSIPVPYLAIYGSAEGALWTDPVSLDHAEGAELSTLKIRQNLLTEVKLQDQLGPARVPLQKGGLVRVFAKMFSD